VGDPAYPGTGTVTVVSGNATLHGDAGCADPLVQPLAAAALRDGVPVYVKGGGAGDVTVSLTLTDPGLPRLRVVTSAEDDLAFLGSMKNLPEVLRRSDYLVIALPLTADRPRIDAAIRDLSASGGTALYDGVYVVLKELERARMAEIRKRVLVLLSDGLDTSSRLSADDMLALARRAGVGIYVIAMPSPEATVPRNRQDGSALQAEYAMRALASDTGARSFFPKKVEELPAIYREIAHELANQYELGYLPSRSGPRGSFKRVSVHVENAIARTRSGYYADQGSIASTPADPSAMVGLVRPH